MAMGRNEFLTCPIGSAPQFRRMEIMLSFPFARVREKTSLLGFETRNAPLRPISCMNSYLPCIPVVSSPLVSCGL